MTRGCRLLLVGFFCVSGAWGGCARPAAPGGPTVVRVSEGDLDVLWDATLTVLRRLEFMPERQDRAAGVIETLPSTSMQFFEFWRRDVADPYAQTMADLQTIQRKATVRFRKSAEAPRWDLDVQVDVFRLQLPERQITSSSSALELYSSMLPTTEGEFVPRGAVGYLEPLGRDAAMEGRIVHLILRHAPAADFEYVEPVATQAASQ